MYVDCLGSFLKCRFQLSAPGYACDSVLLDANSAGLRATLRIVSVKRLLDDSNVQPALRTINGWASSFRLGTMWAQKWNKPIKKHSSIKESLYPKSELSLSRKPHSFVLTFKSKRKGQIFLKKGNKFLWGPKQDWLLPWKGSPFHVDLASEQATCPSLSTYSSIFWNAPISAEFCIGWLLLIIQVCSPSSTPNPTPSLSFP